MKGLLRLASRVVVGTAVYIVIVVLAAAMPAAAGVMLTFPALNGLAFFLSEDKRAQAIARTMMLMPVVNGVLCGAYLVIFILLARTTSSPAVGWALLAAAVGIWFAWVSRKHVIAGIDFDSQLPFAIAATLAGLALTAVTLFAINRAGVSPRSGASAFDPGQAGWFVQAIVNSGLKIVMFALTLAIFAAAIQYFRISDSTRGILAGLPIVPFGGLVSVGGDPALGADLRWQIFLGMVGGVWLGPPLAIWFIYCFSRFLGARRKRDGEIADSIARFGALVASWLVMFGIIVAIGRAVAIVGV